MKKLQVALALALLAVAAVAATGGDQDGGEAAEPQGVFAAPAMPWIKEGN
jgi:hypothetical protein